MVFFSFFLLGISPASSFTVMNNDINIIQSWSLKNYVLQYQTKNVKNITLNGQKLDPCDKGICTLNIELKTPTTNLNIQNSNYLWSLMMKFGREIKSIFYYNYVITNMKINNIEHWNLTNCIVFRWPL